jgi:hypothetical protein
MALHYETYVYIGFWSGMIVRSPSGEARQRGVPSFLHPTVDLIILLLKTLYNIAYL